MATSNYSTIDWKETLGGVTIDCSIDIALHPAQSNVILLTVPGVDGSVDGYEDKYVRIAERVQQEHGAAVVRISNPFITSHHWESNVRHALAYILEHAEEISGRSDPEIRIMAHSAGAAIVGQIAWEYPEITRLLLINPATKLGLEKLKYGLSEFGGNKITILFGSLDPSAPDAEKLSKADQTARMHTFVLDGVDHNFSGESLVQFTQAPLSHLFNQAHYI